MRRLALGLGAQSIKLLACMSKILTRARLDRWIDDETSYGYAEPVSIDEKGD